MKNVSSRLSQDYKILTQKLDNIEVEINKLEKQLNLTNNCDCSQHFNYKQSWYFLAENINLHLMHLDNIFSDDLFQKNNYCSSQGKVFSDIETLLKKLEGLESQINNLQKRVCETEYYKHLVMKFLRLQYKL